ncbi:MAG: hypothetical protein JO069_00510 [Verrucomicrobia bacterium]|nr:hypothetical protein [Verrucomicrobiota bacterium]
MLNEPVDTPEQPSMTRPSQTSPPSSPPQRRSWFFHPLLQISISVVLSSASQIFFKVSTAAGDGHEGIRLDLLSSWALWAGIAATLSSLVVWLNALRSVPLILAYNIGAATYILVPLGSWVFLGEQVPLIRWLGISLVAIGVFVIAGPLSRMEERL